MDFVFGIPSFQRAEKQSTLSYLNRLGYSRDDIYISTQTEEDYRLYSAKYGDKATILYRPGNCVADNRNAILEELKDKTCILFLDDDISGIGVLAKEGKRSEGGKYVRLQSKEQLDAIVLNCFNIAKKVNSPIWGVSFFDNAFFMKRVTRMKALFIGTMFGVLDNTLRFNPQYKVKEDFELCCRMISSGHNCIRFDSLCVWASHKTKGGCQSEWENNESERCSRKLIFEYPDIVREHPTRNGEVKFIKQI